VSAPSALHPEQLVDALAVAGRIGEILIGTGLYSAAAQQAVGSRLHRVHTDPLARRILVWKAMGLLNVRLLVSTPDALALLRARAYATDRLVDDLAHDVITQRIPVEDFQP
jgi:hypothetical protein